MIANTPDPATEPAQELSNDNVAELAQVFKLLGDETRLQIVLHVSRRGEMNVTELCQLFVHSQPLISHHLSLLRSAGVLKLRREGKHNYYSVSNDRFEQLMDALTVQRRCQPPCDRFLDCMLG